MDPSAYDVQICAWKMVKICWKTCLTTSIKHPYVSSSLFMLFLLYTCFPSVFWILIYSIPLVVCSCIALSVYFNVGKVPKHEDGETKARIIESTKTSIDDDPTSKKPYARVHSVRRRRAKEILREEEEKKAVSSTNFNLELVDKNALIEETSPKEIREVEVDSSPVNNNTSPVQEHHDKEEENKDDRVMDVGISDAERTKRLESLIARRRSRKLLSLQVRRSLMNMDKKDHTGGQMPSLMIPKLNTSYGSSKMGSLFSPGPGSAPSILIPVTNPFDLPYDPQEEKPDLTGDSFDREFTSLSGGRDMVFSRHGSFSLGPSLPDGLFKEDTSSLRGFGFRHSREFSTITEQEPKTNLNSPGDDQIKEVIQVYDHDQNGTQNHSEESNGEDETMPIPQSDFNTSSTSPPSSSSEEENPLFKIDREAILKSLSSMRRNALQEIESNEQTGDELNYAANSALENASRLKQRYFANKPLRRHNVSYSIASDMQVEVSEISSPPLTIDENMSYQDEDVSTIDGEMERNISWDGDDMWARGSSHVSEADGSIDSRSVHVNEEEMIDVGVSRIEKPEDDDQLQTDSMEKQALSENEDQVKEYEADGSTDSRSVHVNEEEMIDVGVSRIEKPEDADQLQTDSMEKQALNENEDQVKEYEAVESNPEEIVEVSNQADEQVDGNDQQEQALTPNVQTCVISPNSVLLPTLSLSSFDPDVDEEVHNPVEVPGLAALQNPNAQESQGSSEPANEEVKIQEIDEQPKDSASENQNDFTKNMDQSDNLIPSLSIQEQMIDSTETSDHEDRSENHEETGNDETQTISAASNSLDGTKDEVQDLVVALSEPVEEDQNSESCKNNEGDRQDEEHGNSNEAMQETISTLDSETK